MYDRLQKYRIRRSANENKWYEIFIIQNRILFDTSNLVKNETVQYAICELSGVKYRSCVKCVK